MVYDNRDYWVSEPCVLPDILKELNISETWSLSVYTWKCGKAPTELDPLDKFKFDLWRTYRVLNTDKSY
jgi:hypothetical protein